jgi:ABC-type Fe3+ transport system permease subunit
MTTRLYQNLTLSADPAAFTSAVALAAALVVLSVLVVGPADALTGVGSAPRTAAASGSATTDARSSWWLAAGCGGSSLWRSPSAGRSGVDGIDPRDRSAARPGELDARQLRLAFNQHAYAALRNSLLLAGVAATVVLLLGVLTRCWDGAERAGARHLVTLTFAVSVRRSPSRYCWRTADGFVTP